MFFWLVAGLLFALVAYNAITLLPAIKAGRELARASSPFSASPRDAAHHILVVGDSTAVGTGAESPQDSVAGRISRDYPNSAIENHAEDGAVTAEVAAQLRAADRDNYDLVLIQTGGNDALEFNNLDKVRKDIDTVLLQADRLGDRVVLVSVGDLGTAPAIPWPISYLLSKRANSIRTLFANAAKSQEVPFVDLFIEDKSRDPFARSPREHYARDGLHPSSEGYAEWYQTLRASVPLNEWLTSDS